jgi:hypothetical protein
MERPTARQGSFLFISVAYVLATHFAASAVDSCSSLLVIDRVLGPNAGEPLGRNKP